MCRLFQLCVIYLTDALPGAKVIGRNMLGSHRCRLFNMGVIFLTVALPGAKYMAVI